MITCVAFFKLNCPSDVDANGNKGVIFFTGKKSNGQEYTEADLKDSNGYYELTAGNFTVNDQLLKDSSLLGSRSSELVGVEECGKIKEMIELLSSKEKFNFRNGNAGQIVDMQIGFVDVRRAVNGNRRLQNGHVLRIDQQMRPVCFHDAAGGDDFFCHRQDA